MTQQQKNIIVKAKTMKSIDNALARIKTKAKQIKDSMKKED